MARKLTSNEQSLFEIIRGAPNIALARVTYDGQETAAICAVVDDSDGSGAGTMTPLAILVTGKMFPRITNPFTD